MSDGIILSTSQLSFLIDERKEKSYTQIVIQNVEAQPKCFKLRSNRREIFAVYPSVGLLPALGFVTVEFFVRTRRVATNGARAHRFSLSVGTAPESLGREALSDFIRANEAAFRRIDLPVVYVRRGSADISLATLTADSSAVAESAEHSDTERQARPETPNEKALIDLRAENAFLVARLQTINVL